MPKGQPMPLGILEQHRDEGLRGVEIAGQQGNRAGTLSERVTQRNRMIRSQSFFDTLLGGGYGLVGVPLKPEDRREPRACRHPWIELEADDVWLVNRRAWAIEHTLDGSPRMREFAQEKQRKARHPITDRGGERVGGIRCGPREGLRKRHGLPDIAAIHAIDPQAPERPQAIVGVVQPVRDLERTRKGRARCRNGALREQQRRAQGGQELHFAPLVATRSGPQTGERLFHAPSALVHEREMRPQRHGCDRQSHADRDVPTRGKRPVQGRAHVVDLLAVGGQPLDGGARLQFGLGPLEEVPVVFRVAAAHLGELAARGELLERVGPRRLEQPVSRDGADRKSTRLNSSHLVISYAVFCLKKKKKDKTAVLRKKKKKKRKN